jgi:hypothetical protein
MLGKAGLSFQSVAVRMMFPRAKVLKEKETYADVILPIHSGITENWHHQSYASRRGFYISFDD